jgi:hypothetical protein
MACLPIFNGGRPKQLANKFACFVGRAGLYCGLSVETKLFEAGTGWRPLPASAFLESIDHKPPDMSDVDVRVRARSQLSTSGQKYRTDFPILRKGGPSPVKRRFAHVLALTLERASSCLVFRNSAVVSIAIPHQEGPDQIGNGKHLFASTWKITAHRIT